MSDSPPAQRGADKTARIPVKIVPAPILRKPAWIRARLPPDAGGVARIRQTLRRHGLHTVCEEAACPNLGECFGGGTATFMILGELCTRRCPFCDVAHGRPLPPDAREADNLAQAIAEMQLRYVVITSVDRDDLRDGGAAHFAACIQAVRTASPGIRIEILVPDFRGREQLALEILRQTPPEVFNHNLETVPRLYRQARPGADYHGSLKLIADFKQLCPQIPAKSGLMLGLGETLEEVEEVMRDLRQHGCERLTLGQYLQPSRGHLPVARYVLPEEFARLAELGEKLGFSHVASGPLVRSSYHAEQQAGAASE
jgi:lipoic acid synthetase